MLTGYVAITSNTRQIGARMEFFVKIGERQHRGHPRASTRCGSPTSASSSTSTSSSSSSTRARRSSASRCPAASPGRSPKRVHGKWSIDLWLFSIGGTFDHTFGADRPPAALPAVDPLPPLVAALKEPGNWSTDLAGAPTLVTLRRRDGVLVHPLARIAVRQTVRPALDQDRPLQRRRGRRSGALRHHVGDRRRAPRRRRRRSTSSSRPPSSST